MGQDWHPCADVWPPLLILSFLKESSSYYHISFQSKKEGKRESRVTIVQTAEFTQNSPSGFDVLLIMQKYCFILHDQPWMPEKLGKHVTFYHTQMRFEMWRRGDDAEITCWLHKPIDLSSGLLLPLQSWEQGQVSIAIAKGRRDGRLPGAHCLTSQTELMKVQRQILSHRCGGERSRKTFKLSSGIHMCMHTGACITV